MRKITVTTPSKQAYVNATTYIIPMPTENTRHTHTTQNALPYEPRILNRVRVCNPLDYPAACGPKGHGCSERCCFTAIGKKNRNMLTPVGATESSNLSYQWLYMLFLVRILVRRSSVNPQGPISIVGLRSPFSFSPIHHQWGSQRHVTFRDTPPSAYCLYDSPLPPNNRSSLSGRCLALLSFRTTFLWCGSSCCVGVLNPVRCTVKQNWLLQQARCAAIKSVWGSIVLLTLLHLLPAGPQPFMRSSLEPVVSLT